MDSNLLCCMNGLIGVFHSYSGKEGDKLKLNKAELKELLEKEFCGALGDCKDSKEVDKIIKELDENKDGEVDFQEFITLVAMLTIFTNEFFVGCAQDGEAQSKKK